MKPCWKGYTQKGYKKKGKRTVPNCVPVKESNSESRYCPKCKKEETKAECKYGPEYWEKFAIPTTNQSKFSVASVHPSNESFNHIITHTSADARRAQTREKIKKLTTSPNTNEADAAKRKLGGVQLPLVNSRELKSYGDFIREATSKKDMACNKPKSDPVGDSITGKSHVVKACSGGKEKLIRFGQRGVKGSPKKEGESDRYKNRRKRFQARHAKNIKKGKMSAAYWANRVKW